MTPPPATIMVTGATTPLGHALVAQLLADPRTKRVIACGIEEGPHGLERECDGERLCYVRADLSRAREIRGLMHGPARDFGVEVIVHSALHRRASDAGRKIHRLNVESTRLILQLAEAHPTLRRMVYRSYAEVYDVQADQPTVIEESHQLNLSPKAPQWIRDRVEGDLTVCTRMGMSPLSIAVLRCAEVFAADVGSQLYDYTRSRVCFRPLGYDPMLNLLSIEDAVEATRLAVFSEDQAIFNIPGADTLPLTEAILHSGRLVLPAPGMAVGPLYRLRRLTTGTDFRYDLNAWRFHFSGVLDGRRAAKRLGYKPQSPIVWPRA